MTQIDFKAINDQIEALEKRRSNFKVAGICCGVGAICPIWAGIFGGLAPLAWLAALICGFRFRKVAIRARDEAMRLRLSIANLDPSSASAGAQAPPAKPAAPKAKPQTTSSRLDKARRREE